MNTNGERGRNIELLREEDLTSKLWTSAETRRLENSNESEIVCSNQIGQSKVSGHVVRICKDRGAETALE